MFSWVGHAGTNHSALRLEVDMSGGFLQQSQPMADAEPATAEPRSSHSWRKPQRQRLSTFAGSDIFSPCRLPHGWTAPSPVLDCVAGHSLGFRHVAPLHQPQRSLGKSIGQLSIRLKS